MRDKDIRPEAKSEIPDLPLLKLSADVQKLVTDKLAAVVQYRESEVRLRKANLELVKAGIAPDLGSACW
jgi:hypothetical protein